MAVGVARAQTLPSMFAMPGAPGVAGGSGGATQASPPVLPYRIVKISPFYRERVVELFEFTCPFCRQVNDGALAWGTTLPKPFVFEQVPIVYDNATAKAAMFFYIVAKADPSKLQSFMSAVFAAVQDQHASLDDSSMYIRAIAQAGITEAQFRAQLSDSAGVEAYIDRVAQLCKKVAPRATPTFIVADHVTDVNYTNGDYQKLFKLLDGLVSQQLHRG
jgi:protein-disulfide isomerase